MLIKILGGGFEYIPSNNTSNYIHLYAPVNISNTSLQLTSIICLDIDKDIIFSNFDKKTKYEIHRAKTKDLYKKILLSKPSKEQLLKFLVVFKEFMIQKKLNYKVVDNFYKDELQKRLSNDKLLISRIWNNDNGIDIWHVYTEEITGRIRLTCSASLFRNLTPAAKSLNGRLNRLLHWYDICKSKNLGFKIYDFGGLNFINEDVKSVTKFKLEFSNIIEKRYNAVPENPSKNKIFTIFCSDSKYIQIAYELTNQLSDEYMVCISKYKQKQIKFSDKNLRIPDDLISKRLFAFNPLIYYYMHSNNGQACHIKYSQIKSKTSMEKNYILNQNDFVLIKIENELDIFSLIECMATGVYVLLTNMETCFLEIINEISVLCPDSFEIVENNLDVVLSNLSNIIKELRAQRQFRADNVYKSFCWMNALQRIKNNI